MRVPAGIVALTGECVRVYSNMLYEESLHKRAKNALPLLFAVFSFVCVIV